MQHRVLIIIPAYNEEHAIIGTIQSLRATGLPVDIVVIDDGSRDRTAAMVEEMGVGLISLPYNLGIGGAVQTGYRYAYRHGYDVAVQLDADGQHDPSDLPALLAELERSGAGMVVGSRFCVDTGYKAPLSRRIGMVFFAFLVSRIAGYRITDTTSGYRAAGRQVITLFAEWYPSDYPEVEALVYLNKKGIRIREVPVTMKERQGGTSSITMMRGIYYMIKVTLAILVSLLQRGEHR